MENEYNKICRLIKYLEKKDYDSPEAGEITYKITKRIDWAFKFHKITEEQKNKLCNFMISYFND